jgi:hopanoid biosynthesis associated protein HpnK
MRGERGRRRVIFTADDFGLSAAVNEAVERAHRDGVLTTASLMVGAPAAADAVARARRLPELHVGLHLTLLDGRPVLPPARVPLLVSVDGRFASDELGSAIRYFVTPGIRAQLAGEIEAQFAAFAATGLRLDHVNAHHHLHVHPTIFGLVLRSARAHGAPPVRIPREAGAPWWLVPWLGLMARRARRAGIATNDRVVGMRDSGRMTPARLLAQLRALEPGVTEAYLHPGSAPDDLAALLDPAVSALLRESAIERVTFAELGTAR